MGESNINNGVNYENAGLVNSYHHDIDRSSLYDVVHDPIFFNTYELFSGDVMEVDDDIPRINPADLVGV